MRVREVVVRMSASFATGHITHLTKKPTLKREMAPPPSISAKRAASKRKVQRAWPSGAAAQVRASRCASWAPSSLCGCVTRGRRRSITPSPAAANSRRTREMVVRLTSTASLMAVSVQPGPPGPQSALSKMRARVIARAADCPWPITSSSRARCAASKTIGCRRAYCLTGKCNPRGVVASRDILPQLPHNGRIRSARTALCQDTDAVESHHLTQGRRSRNGVQGAGPLVRRSRTGDAAWAADHGGARRTARGARPRVADRSRPWRLHTRPRRGENGSV